MAFWQHCLAKGDVKTHETSIQQIKSLWALIARDLADACLPGLSSDRKFATAYNAALQTATIVVVCSGYRVSARAGHHKVTFEAATFAIGAEAHALCEYFDTCRRKRNAIDYMTSWVATETETAEIIKKANEFRIVVEKWVTTKHPFLAN